MFTSPSTASTTRNNTRRLPLFAAGAVLLAAGATAGVAAQRHGGSVHHVHNAGSTPALQPAGGNVSQADSRGGVADSHQFQPVAAGAANALPAIPRGGYAEWLDGQRAAAAGSSMQPIPRGGYAEFLRNHPAAGATLAARPMGGYAEWLLWRSEAGQTAAP